MATTHECAGTLLRHLRHLAGAAVNDRTDADLVRLFVTSGDETAFAALVHRHSPMVWGVCRHVLHHEQDAEDAFQTTFVALGARPPRSKDGIPWGVGCTGSPTALP